MERQSRVVTAEERATATKSREGQREIVFYWTPESGVTQRKWELHPPCAKREEATGQIELQPEMLPEVERVGEEHPNFCLPTTIQFPNSTALSLNPARSQQILGSGKCSLQRPDRAVRGTGHVKIWGTQDQPWMTSLLET